MPGDDMKVHGLKPQYGKDRPRKKHLRVIASLDNRVESVDTTIRKVNALRKVNVINTTTLPKGARVLLGQLRKELKCMELI